LLAKLFFGLGRGLFLFLPLNGDIMFGPEFREFLFVAAIGLFLFIVCICQIFIIFVVRSFIGRNVLILIGVM